LERTVASAPERGETAAQGGSAVEHGAGATAESPAAHGNEGAVPQSVGEGEAGRVPVSEHAHDNAEVSQERLFTGISILVGLIGIGIGWTVFRKRPLLEMPRLLENKYYVDEAYDAALIEPIKTGSRSVLWKFF